MVERYKILYLGGEGGLIEKKSRFIATSRPVRTEEEAAAFIEEMRKKYWDARHHCSAYVLGSRGQIARCSDDGEPAQTAGKPILDVLLGAGVRDICMVVTRYFGGVLLGTGGLVRAYSGATREGLSAGVILEKVLGQKMEVTTDYAGLGKIQHAAAQSGVTVMDIQYTDQVRMALLVPYAMLEQTQKMITEKTSARARIALSGPLYFGIAKGKAILFECRDSDA